MVSLSFLTILKSEFFCFVDPLFVVNLLSRFSGTFFLIFHHVVVLSLFFVTCLFSCILNYFVWFCFVSFFVVIVHVLTKLCHFRDTHSQYSLSFLLLSYLLLGSSLRDASKNIDVVDTDPQTLSILVPLVLNCQPMSLFFKF